MESMQLKTNHLSNSKDSNKQQVFIHNLLFPKKSWSEQEDKLLVSVVNRLGATKWSHIAKYIPYRTGKQCRQRWFNHLSPTIRRDEWTDEEEWILFLAHIVLGSKWSKLTKLLQGRTDNSIKNHWNSIMRKRIPEMEGRFQKLCQFDNPPKSNKSKATDLLNDLRKQVGGLILCEDSKGEKIIDSHLLNSQSSSDSLSFSHILKKIDEKDTLALQRKESYQYCGWQSLSNEKQKPRGIGEKENRLCQIEDLMEEEEDLALPLPIKRLSSDFSQYDHSRLLKNDSQLIL